MNMHTNAGSFRGLARPPRADASETDLKRLLEDMNKTFASFKEANEERIKGVENKFADVLQTEKVSKINAEISDLQKAIDDTNKMLAALKAGGATKDGETPEAAEHKKAFNRFFRRGVDADLQGLAVKAGMATDSDPDGGYTVPVEMEKTIDRVLGTVSVMRELARVMSISTGSYKKLVNMGGAGYGWVGERSARPETATPTLRELLFNVFELYANPAATQTLLDDSSVDIAAWLADEVAVTFAEQEGAAFIAGDGVNKPRGLLSYDTVDNGSYAWGKLGFVKTGAAATFDTPTASVNPADALIRLFYALKAGYRNNASFLTSDAVMGSIRQFKDADGAYIWAPPTAAAPVATILGKPVYTDDNMQALGANAFPVAFGDFKRGYLIVDRTGVRVLRDPFTNKPYVHFYTTKRVGGGVQNFEAIKLLKCST